ncbi:MAG: bile acid:sodium symporter family protein [Victivallaceae bacterium]|nr:bile acid:sodium symporter family protein [Victivallaceae bacterium]
MFEILKKLSGILASRTAIFVAAAGAAAYFFPGLFRWVKGDVQTAVLGIIMLTMGMTLSKSDYKILAKRPLDIFIGAAAQYSLMPLLAWLLVTSLHLPKAVAVGLLLVGTCPGGVSSNIMTFLARGDVAFSVGMTTASTLLAPLMTPILMYHLAGENINVDAWGMFRSILIVTLIPVGIGSFMNFGFGEKRLYKKTMDLMPAVSVIGLACIVGGIMSFHGNRFFTAGLTIFAAVAAHNTLGYLTGYLVGKMTRMNKAKCRTISIEVGCQNAGLGTALASRHFAQLPEAALVAAVACVYHSLSGTVLANLFALADRRAERSHAKIVRGTTCDAITR